MSLLRINRHPAAKDLRLFALLWLVFLGIFASSAALRGHLLPACIVGGLAFVIGVAGLLHPPLVRLVYLGAVYVTFPIGFVMSHLILGVVYFIVITPIGLLMRLVGRDPLTRRFDPGSKSYWLTKTDQRSPASYFKQH